MGNCHPLRQNLVVLIEMRSFPLLKLKKIINCLQLKFSVGGFCFCHWVFFLIKLKDSYWKLPVGAIKKGLVSYTLLFISESVSSLRNAYCLAQFVLVLFSWKPSASIMRFIIL